jgi:hypothetical protein
MNTEIEMQNMVETISSATLEAIQQSYKAWQTNDLTIVDTLFSPDWQEIQWLPGKRRGLKG